MADYRRTPSDTGTGNVGPTDPVRRNVGPTDPGRIDTDRIRATPGGSLASMRDTRDFEVQDGEPDPRGWELRGAGDRRLGEVDDMIVDTDALKVRYVVADLDENAAAGRTNRRVLIPIAGARLDEDRRSVLVDGYTDSDLKALPSYEGIDAIGAGGTAYSARAASAGTRAREALEEDAERHITRSEEELDIARREVRAGEVEIDKRVETEHVRRPVTRHREEVDVERRPASGLRASQPKIGDDEIHIPVHEEEIVVDKHPVVREEIVVRKRDVEDREIVEADLRREKVDVHDRTKHHRGDRDRNR